MLDAGRYYIGDLSVVLSPEEVKHLEQFPDGYCSLPDGKTMWKQKVDNLVYRTSLGNSISVSIGVIGVIPYRPEFDKKEYVVNINRFGMMYSSLDKPVDVKNDRGDIIINTLIIDTNNDSHFGGEPIVVENNKEFLAKLLEANKGSQL